MLKRYFWLAYLLLVTCAAVMTAGIAKGYVTMWLSAPSARPPARISGTTAPAVQRMALADYAIISERNLFNANPPSSDPAPAAEVKPVEEVVQPTQRRLRLVGIVAGDLPPQQYAIIEDLERSGTQDIYQVGDVVQQAAIIDIRPDCVLLDTRRQHEKLCFDYDEHTGDTNGRPAPPHGPGARGDSAAAVDEPGDGDVVRVDQGTWRVNRDLIMEQFADLGTLSRQVRVTPHSIQGKPSGFRLTRLRPGLLRRIGLINGDVLQRVNGLDINSPEEALKAYQVIQSEPTVRLEILRRNSPTTLTYEIR
jgi:general secretion pathway protein C